MSKTTTAPATALSPIEAETLLSAVRPHDYVDLLATYFTHTVVGTETLHTIVTMERIVGMGGADYTAYPVTRYTVNSHRFLGKFRKRFLKQVGFDVEFTYNDAAMQVQMQLDAAAGMVIR